jgi:hypothetical protein
MKAYPLKIGHSMRWLALVFSLFTLTAHAETSSQGNILRNSMSATKIQHLVIAENPWSMGATLLMKLHK